MQKVGKYLTKFISNPNYTQLLRIVGRSSHPLSSYQIKREIEKAGLNESNSPYVYQMIKELLDIKVEKREFSISWNNIPGSKIQEERLIRILNEVYNLILVNKSDTVFNKSEDGQCLTVTHGRGIKIIVTLMNRETGETTIEIENNGISTLVREGISFDKRHSIVHFNRSQKFEDMLHRDRNHPLPYLDRTVSCKSKEVIRQKVEHRQKILDNIGRRGGVYSKFSKETDGIDLELSRFLNDTRISRYSINIRGLILYLLGEIQLQTTDGRIRNSRISKVLINLSKNYIAKFPFLQYYNDFREEFDYLSILKVVPSNFEIELLKEIANELQNQVFYATEAFLNYWVTRRYSSGIAQCFQLAFDFYNSVRKTEETSSDPTLKKFREYQLQNIRIISEYLSNELKDLTYKSDNLEITLKLISSYPSYQAERDVDFTLFRY